MPRSMRDPAVRMNHSQDTLVSNPTSPRSNTIPLIELGRSLENIRGYDMTLGSRSVENLDGIIEDGYSYRSELNSERNNAVPQADSLESMPDIEDFRALGSGQKFDVIMKLLPMLSPFANQLDQDLSSMAEDMERVFDKLDSLESQNNNSGAYHIPAVELLSERGGVPTTALIRQSRIINRRVRLNVGGVRHEVMWRMLEQIPNSRLGMLCKADTHFEILQLAADYSLIDNEYFFDRHPRSFNTILNFYRTGKLHIADEMCVMSFKEDLEYWAIPEPFLESCCQNKFLTKKDLVMEEMEVESSKLARDEEEDFGEGKLAIYQKFLWDLIEKPDTSFAAKIVSSISIIFVVVSTVGMTLNTMQYFQHQDINDNAVDNPKLALIESVCISWFTLEYLLRFAGSPNKWDFLKDGMNIIDVLAIMPYYVSLFLVTDQPITTETKDEDESGGIDEILQVFRIFKLARIFKLGRHSPGLQSIFFTLKMSYRELGLLVMLVFLSGLIFASLCFFIEEDSDSGFTSIPVGIYWVVITMTTVGYGDIFPVTGLGKLVGSLCAISGVLVMSLPIPIIAGNFEKFHREQAKRNKLARRRAALKEAKKVEEKERLSEISSGELGFPGPAIPSGKPPKARSPVVSLLTARTWGSRKSSEMRSRANSTAGPDNLKVE